MTHMSRRLALATALLSASLAPTTARSLGSSRPSRKRASAVSDDGFEAVTPAAVSASHNCKGYGPECAVDSNERTFWLVPGGARMEMMS